MLAGGSNRVSASINAGDRKAEPGHGFGGQAAATANIEQAQASKWADKIGSPTKVVRQPRTNIAEPRRVELVQRTEIAFGLPPSIGLYVKSPDLAEIDRGIVSVQRMFPIYLAARSMWRDTPHRNRPMVD